MQFISNGPDVPHSLLQAHEEGRVVFFCGAGISYPAGLPGFEELVNKIYEFNGTALTEIEESVHTQKKHDAVLDLLEKRLPGQRLDVRRALAKALKPKLKQPGATDTHKALLELAKARSGSLRLVTTNFDRIFHSAASQNGQKFQEYNAPMLPIPKNSRWDGLVFLHGLLPSREDDTALNKLVVTSGDFGLAYLTERWAARFVSELFRNYIVCFVGYSINDPILRYMMDALSADRMLGEHTPEAWAFADYKPGHKQNITKTWAAKGVTPILYEVPSGTHDHSNLHRTIKAWAETYRDGVYGKERIVASHAITHPSDSTQEDNFIGRMLWALSDSSGLPAKRFAKLNPAPPLDWLFEAFSDSRFQHSDLNHFNVVPHDRENEDFTFSLISRPAPYDYSPRMEMASTGPRHSDWDAIMHYISCWLLRHLNDPRLIVWIAQLGGELHPHLVRLIESELDSFKTLIDDEEDQKIEEIRARSPNAIPSRFMVKLWALLLSGQIRNDSNHSGLYRWKSRLAKSGLTFLLRMELRELLAPKIVLKKPLGARASEGNDQPDNLKSLVKCELILTSDRVYRTLSGTDGGKIDQVHWHDCLPSLLDDFQQLLINALDLLREVEQADDFTDRSYWDLPSIDAHWQNRGFNDWVSLIELLREAWLEIHNRDELRAKSIAMGWFGLPYPTFKRLALFAASKSCIDTTQWVDWLLSDDGYWLWSTETQREVCRLMVLQGGSLTATSQSRLEACILSGMPDRMRPDGIEDEEWQVIVERATWLLLSKLKVSSLTLGDSATVRLNEISKENPTWKLIADQREEFSYWMTSSGDPGYKESKRVMPAPRNWRELVVWLKAPPREDGDPTEDTWRDVCRTRFFHSTKALQTLSDAGTWPEKRWKEALQAWSDGQLVVRSWHYAAPLIRLMPDDTKTKILYSLTYWLRLASKPVSPHGDILVELSEKALDMQLVSDRETFRSRGGERTLEPITDAINHPVGHVTEALINYWFHQAPKDNDLLHGSIRKLFTKICNIEVNRFRHGRVLLGSRLIPLFRVDREWTSLNLLPLFSWEKPSLALPMWIGFLWSPRLHQPLLASMKSDFLAVAQHYSELGEYRQQFVGLLTYAALERIEGYTVDDFRTAIAALPNDGLEKCAETLYQAVESGSEEHKSLYWKNRVRPFLEEIWPKHIEMATPEVSKSLIPVIIAAREQFPTALSIMKSWLRPTKQLYSVLDTLKQSNVCEEHPEAALQLLDRIVGNVGWESTGLQAYLHSIAERESSLKSNKAYVRLMNLCLASN